MTYTELRQEIGYDLGYGRTSGDWDTTQAANILAALRGGYRQFLRPPILPGEPTSHEWSFLTAMEDFVVWTDVASTSMTVTGAGNTTITAASASFFPSMIGHSIVGDATGTSYEITAFTSSTIITVASDASAEIVTGTAVGQATVVSGVSTLTADNVFTSAMVGGTLRFDASGNEFVIAGFTSGTVVTLTGDASGEASNDTFKIDGFTIAADGNYRLPDQYGGLHGPLQYADEDHLNHNIEITGVGNINSLRQRPLQDFSSIRPSVGALLALPTTGLTPQRWDLMLWRTPDEDHTLNLRFKVQQNELTDTNEFPLGGMAHGETLLASCLAYAEQHVNDEVGLHWQNFMQQLVASVSRDRSDHQPDILGYNSDNRRGNGAFFRNQTTTINGVTPT